VCQLLLDSIKAYNSLLPLVIVLPRQELVGTGELAVNVTSSGLPLMACAACLQFCLLDAATGMHMFSPKLALHYSIASNSQERLCQHGQCCHYAICSACYASRTASAHAHPCGLHTCSCQQMPVSVLWSQLTYYVTHMPSVAICNLHSFVCQS
jgi:hypothetical protein